MYLIIVAAIFLACSSCAPRQEPSAPARGCELQRADAGLPDGDFGASATEQTLRAADQVVLVVMRMEPEEVALPTTRICTPAACMTKPLLDGGAQ